MVTAGTYGKTFLLNTPAKLTLVRDSLFSLAAAHGWQLQAWAIMGNHYHFVALAPQAAASLRPLVQELHRGTAAGLNKADGTPGRRVWFQYWDSLITYERSYLARLHYVHTNPVHHGLVPDAAMYPFCSATWFRQNAERTLREKVASFKIDRLNVPDDF